jgi:tRNA(fMet)-specific endonuclease VapC
MGKNALWIAAIASIQNAIVMTTDQDFDRLNPAFVKVEYVDVMAMVVPPAVTSG